MNLPRPPLLRLDGLHRLLMSSALVQGLGLVLTLLLGILLARWLGPVSLGVYGLFMATVSIANVPAQFGLPILALKEAAAAESPRDGLSILSCFLGRAVATSTVTIGGLIIVILLCAPGELEGRWGAVVAAAGIVVITALLAVATAVLRGLGHNLWGQTLDLLLKPGLTVASVFIMFVMLGTVSAASALAAQLAAVLLCSGLAGFSLLRVMKRNETNSGPPRRNGPWRQAAFAIMLNAMLGVLNGNYPLITAGLIVSGPDIGVFRVALSSASLLALPAAVANIAAGPLVARHHAQGDGAMLARTLSHTTLASFGATLAGLIVFALFGRTLVVALFGEAYREAYQPLLILGVAQLITAAFGIAGTYLTLTGRETVVLRAFALSVPLGIASSVVLAGYWGIAGAAASTIVMTLAWHLYVFGHRRRIDVPLSLVAAIRHVGGRGISGGRQDRC